MVSSRHLGTPGDLRIPRNTSDGNSLERWCRLARSMKSNGSIAIVQLVHTGRQSPRCAGRWPWQAPLAPSAIKVAASTSSTVGKIVQSVAFQKPRSMSRQDIDQVIKEFIAGARLAEEAGFDGIQLHARWVMLFITYTSLPPPPPRKPAHRDKRRQRNCETVTATSCPNFLVQRYVVPL